MSKWCSGKLELRCSIDVLRRALIGVRPQWESSIAIDENGRIPMYRYRGQRAYEGTTPQNVHVLIPGGGNPNYAGPPDRQSNNDWGFRKIGSDQWEVTYGDFGSQNAIALQNEIKGKVLMMKAQAMAKIRGTQIANHTEDEDEEVMDLVIDKETAKQFLRT